MYKIINMTNIAAQTLASIVTNNSQSATVLEKYNLDFCCKGKRTLTEACAEKGLSIEEVLSELANQEFDRKLTRRGRR